MDISITHKGTFLISGENINKYKDILLSYKGSLDISSGAWEVPMKYLKEVTDATKNEPPPKKEIRDSVYELTAANAHRRIDKILKELEEIRDLLKEK